MLSERWSWSSSGPAWGQDCVPWDPRGHGLPGEDWVHQNDIEEIASGCTRGCLD